MNDAAVQTNPVIIWALAIVSVLLVAIITYVYTNRNRRVTLIFTLFSILFLGLLKLTSIIDVELQNNFLGTYTASNTIALAAEPGWGLLIHGWHIWILPVIFVALLFCVIVYFILSYQKSPHAQKLEVHSAIAARTNTAQEPFQQMKVDRLNTFMAVDAAKKQARVAHQKLSEALLNNAANEIKINDLNMRISSLEIELQQTQKQWTDNTAELEKALEEKNIECHRLERELVERSQSLMEAQKILKNITGA